MKYPLKVSVVIPARNEEKHISKVLDSLVMQDYEKDNLEIIVVDGMSADNTRGIVNEYARTHKYIKLIENQKKFTPFAFNIGIRQSSSDIIVFMGSHTTYSNNYISTIVKYILEDKADCVGSVAVTLPATDGVMAKFMVAAITSVFGVGNSFMRLGVKNPKYVDTASCPGYKREVFQNIGLFNEELIRHQDNEFNKRLIKAGGRILLVPEIKSYYYARSDLKMFIKYYFIIGLWVMLSFAKSDYIPVSWRHLIPLIFIVSLLSAGLFGFSNPLFRILFLAVITTYLMINIIASFQIAYRKKDKKYLFAMPFIFTTLHFSYGIGSLCGVCKLLTSKRFWIKLFEKRKVCNS